MVQDEIIFYGHPNVRSTHTRTIEITKAPTLSLRGDCIIGVNANKACRDLKPTLKHFKFIGQDLDKRSDLSLVDTDILSAKARQAGYTLACCRDLFVHHFGARTFTSGAPEKKENATVS